MRLVVTGGGTGGHVFPALEIAKAAREHGAEVSYFGSLRGQEGEASARFDFPFTGFPSEPIYSIKTPRGWSGLLKALRASRAARRELVRQGIDVVFSTGGYSAAPVMQAARSLGIPFVIHEANSVPGRSNRLFVKRASAFTCVFQHTTRLFPTAIRTGQPIRAELRAAAAVAHERRKLVTVIGGSQGSVFLNKRVPEAASLLSEPVQFLHAVGPKNFHGLQTTNLPVGYEMKPFIEAPELALAYAEAMVAIGRSGGTLAEYAVFRLPSILIPLPTSADDHQLHNAKEFEQMGAATVLVEDRCTPSALAEAIQSWTSDLERCQRAEQALQAWDLPEATTSITDLVMGAYR